MQEMGRLVMHDADAQEVVGTNQDTCLVTSSAVLLGAYVDLWAVVTAYTADGTLLEAGDETYKDLCE